MQWTDDIRIETPEQIEVSLEIAGVGSRFVAQVIDWLIKWTILFVAGVAILIAAALLGISFRMETAPIFLLALLGAMFYAFLLGFDIYYEVRQNGQTPGKKFAGIRVLRESGGPLDFRAAGIRNLLGLADFLPAFYMLGALIAMVSPRGQRLGDVAAGTLVIRERALRPPAELEKEMERLASNDFVFTADQLAACAGGDRHVLRSFLQRYGEMEAHSRHQLATRLAQTLSQRMAYQPSIPISDGCRAEAFLASLYRDLEKWVRHGR